MEKLLKIGSFFSAIVFISDWLLEYGVEDPNASGMLLKLLSTYVNIPDWRIVLSGVLGLLGITIEGLSYFGIYRLLYHVKKLRKAGLKQSQSSKR